MPAAAQGRRRERGEARHFTRAVGVPRHDYRRAFRARESAVSAI
ncbi:hypothetical protein [Streptomyces sp. BRA346]